MNKKSLWLGIGIGCLAMALLGLLVIAGLAFLPMLFPDAPTLIAEEVQPTNAPPVMGNETDAVDPTPTMTATTQPADPVPTETTAPNPTETSQPVQPTNTEIPPTNTVTPTEESIVGTVDPSDLEHLSLVPDYLTFEMDSWIASQPQASNMRDVYTYGDFSAEGRLQAVGYYDNPLDVPIKNLRFQVALYDVSGNLIGEELFDSFDTIIEPKMEGVFNFRFDVANYAIIPVPHRIVLQDISYETIETVSTNYESDVLPSPWNMNRFLVGLFDTKEVIQIESGAHNLGNHEAIYVSGYCVLMGNNGGPVDAAYVTAPNLQPGEEQPFTCDFSYPMNISPDAPVTERLEKNVQSSWVGINAEYLP